MNEEGGDPMDATATTALPCGDRGRMGQILLRAGPRLTAVARRVLRDPEAAADVVQSSFEKILRHCRQFRGGALASTWMHRIVVNEAFAWLRHEARRRPARLQPEDWNLVLDPPATPERSAMVREAQARMERALGCLSADERSLLTEAVLEGRPYAAVAEELGLSTGGVKSRVFRARQHLARALGSS
jgi:RNA polymerase sigma-70 factor (ECF subfamily)